MIAKKIIQIFSGLKNSSLQVSLQKQLLNFSLQRTFRLKPSLQLQTLCKENMSKYQSFIKMSFAEILN